MEKLLESFKGELEYEISIPHVPETNVQFIHKKMESELHFQGIAISRLLSNCRKPQALLNREVSTAQTINKAEVGSMFQRCSVCPKSIMNVSLDVSSQCAQCSAVWSCSYERKSINMHESNIICRNVSWYDETKIELFGQNYKISILEKPD